MVVKRSVRQSVWPRICKNLIMLKYLIWVAHLTYLRPWKVCVADCACSLCSTMTKKRSCLKINAMETQQMIWFYILHYLFIFYSFNESFHIACVSLPQTIVMKMKMMKNILTVIVTMMMIKKIFGDRLWVSITPMGQVCLKQTDE